MPHTPKPLALGHAAPFEMADTKTVAALACTQLTVTAGEQPLLRSVDLVLPAGQWTAVVGPNGAGKSTLLRALAGLAQPHRVHGSVQLLGRALAQWPRKARAQTMAWLGQNEVVAHDLGCYDVVMLGRVPHQPWLSAPSAQDRAVVEHSLRACHAWEWRHRALSELSGGERQRVLLARALAVQAQVLLMDEPLVNLDPPHQADWMDTVCALMQQGGTVVSVLHELGIALQSDHMVILQAGHVRHCGPTGDAATHAALEAVFDHRIRVRQIDGMWMALPLGRTSPCAQ